MNAPRLTDWITAIAAAATFLVAAFALLYARGQVKEAGRGRQLTRDLDIERSQPYVVAFMERTASSEALVDLVIRNYGLTAAKNVHIELDPWPERSTELPTDPNRRVEVPDVIPFLAPGQEWRTLWDLGHSRHASDLPDKHVGKLRYTGVHDMSLDSAVILDWSAQKGRRWAVTRGIHDAADALVKIEERSGGRSTPTSEPRARRPRMSRFASTLRNFGKAGVVASLAREASPAR
jgi:hypothetical protein